MRTSAAILLMILACLLPDAAFGQYVTADVRLADTSGEEATFESLCSAPKGKDAMEAAVEGTFNVLFLNGIDGLHDGQPMFASESRESKSFLYRFFHDSLYKRFLAGNPVKVSDKKVNGDRQVTVRLTLRLAPLVKEARNSGVILNPAWDDPKKTEVSSAVNPVVVVVPYVAGKGDDGFAAMKDVMDASVAKAHAVSEVSSAFAKNGYRTRDFVTTLKNSRTSEILTADAQDDARSMVLRQLPGDIVVSVDVKVDGDGRSNGCTLDIRAVEAQTERVLGSVAYASGRYMTSDTVALVRHALSKVEKPFFDGIRTSFDRMVSEGRSMAIEFNLAQSVSDWDFDTPSPATGDDFKIALEDWLAENSYKGVFEMGHSSDKYIAASLNIPIWDTERKRAYSVNRFSSDFGKFMRSQLGDEYKAGITTMGQKLIVTIE